MTNWLNDLSAHSAILSFKKALLSKKKIKPIIFVT